MKVQQSQRSELLPGGIAVLVALLLCVLFVLYLHSLFLNAVGQYDTRSREHARALFLRADAEEFFVESTTRILSSEILAKTGVSRLGNLTELPGRKSSGVEGINDNGAGVIMWGEAINPKELADDFFSQAKFLANIESVLVPGKHKERRVFLVSAEYALLFNSLGTVEDWKDRFRQNSIELDDYIENVRAAISHDDADSTDSTGTNRTTVWTSVHASVADGVEVITCYAPIYDQRGRLTSYLMSEVPVSGFENREWLQQQEMSLVLFDSKDRLVIADPALRDTRAVMTQRLSARGPSSSNFEVDGAWLLIFVDVPQTQWRVVYGVPLIEVFLTHWLAIVLTSCALILGLAGIFLITRTARRRLPISTQLSSMKMVDVRDLLQAVMDRSLVGFCLLRRRDGEVLIQNELSRELSAVEVQCDGRRWGLIEYFLKMSAKEISAEEPLKIDALTLDTGCQIHILAHLLEINYLGEPALFCSFGDDSKRKREELLLASAKEVADEANAAKSAFLAMMSHEVRTPLYGVMGTLELLANTPLLAQQRGYLSTIEHSSSNLLNIIDDILDFSRIEANQLTLESAPFNIAELAEGVARSFVSLSRRKGVDLYCFLEPDLPLLAGDRNRLQQVLNNLLSNAVKFTDSGKIVIRVGGTENAVGRFDVRIQVSDTGIGIRKAAQVELFEPFVQADNSTARRFGGTGLGLSICRKLTELMGGEIELVSELGLGSSFTLLLELPVAGKLKSISLAGLPTVQVFAGANDQRKALLTLIEHAGGESRALTEAPSESAHNDLLLVAWSHRPDMTFGHKFAGVVWLDPEGAPTPEWREDGWYVSSLSQHGILHALLLADENQPGEVGASPANAPSVLTELHALVVEDHPINQLVLTEQLQQLGCQVTVASDGREALLRWQSGEQFDIVVTDVNMPELDGYQLTRRLRAEGITVPIVGVTANAQTDEGERCVQAGMDGYLAKPISLARLREALQAVGVSIADAAKINVIAKLDEIKPAMRDLFVSTTRHDWAAMMKSLSEGNAAAVTRYAHRLKGALVTIGAMEAAEFCSHLEEVAASGHLSSVDECLDNLRAYLDPILEASS